MDSDDAPGEGYVVDMFGDGILGGEFAFLLQEEDGGGGELLGEGGDAELGLGRVGELVFAVGEAAGRLEDNFAAMLDGDGAREMLLATGDGEFGGGKRLGLEGGGDEESCG